MIGLTKALAVEPGPERHHRQHHPAQPRGYADGAGRPEAAGDFPGVDVVGPWCRSAGRERRLTSPPPAPSLCSEDGSYITGQIIGVNGGMYI